jgi:uncharacterized surface protein with fasciclin (FAS1) repeats
LPAITKPIRGIEELAAMSKRAEVIGTSLFLWVCVIGEPAVSQTVAGNEKNLLADEIHSHDHQNLSTAMSSAGLGSLLKGTNAMTMFAPTDAAFAEHQGDKVGELVQGKDKAKLAKFLNCHIISGKVTTQQLMQNVRNGRGSFDSPTLGGCNLNFTVENGKVVVQDEMGGKAKITASSETSGNAMVQTIDHVLVPKMQ